MSNNSQHNKNAQRNGKSVVQVIDVVKSFPLGGGEITILKGISFEVGQGEFVSIVGPSGNGKSTLLNMITGIDRPSAGEVIVNNTAVNKLSENQMALWRGRNLGIVFQFFQLLPTISVIENIMLPMDFCNTYPMRQREKRARELLDLVEVREHAYKLPTALSGGQQQRAAIARALANDPDLLIADEPTGNLDTRTAGDIFDLFSELVVQGKTLLMVTHDKELARRVPRVVEIIDGKITRDEFVGGAAWTGY